MSVCLCACPAPAGVLAYDQDHARQRICNWLDGHKASAAAFDFPTKGILQYAVGKCEYWRLADSKNKPPGLLGWWPSKSVVSGGRAAAARGCVCCWAVRVLLKTPSWSPRQGYGRCWQRAQHATSQRVCLLRVGGSWCLILTATRSSPPLLLLLLLRLLPADLH